jgi:precorrin-8X/cobalt-precorrin-8 methylmutase
MHYRANQTIMIKYEKSPKKIQLASTAIVKEGYKLDHLNFLEKQIARQMAVACADLSILDNIRFSENAIELALEALDEDFDLLCDTETVVCALKSKYLKNEPLCFINKANIISQAKSKQLTRSMLAVDLWKPYLPESIIIIGAEPTALFRLLEVLEEYKDASSNKKPALIIATPVGFTGAEKAKQALWDCSKQLNIPCITLLGTRGGNDIAATIMNKLLQIQKNNQQ